MKYPQDQQQQAQRLYFQSDLSKTQIADAVGISRRTLHYWIHDNHWERIRQCSAIMPSLIAENCYHLMNRYTVQLLADDRADKPVTREEVNNLHKLAVTIGKVKNRSTLNESMEMFAYFMDSVNDKSPELAEIIEPLVSDFVASRASGKAIQFTPSRPATTATKEEQDREAQLDKEDMEVWAAERQAAQQQAAAPAPSSAPAQAASTQPAPIKAAPAGKPYIPSYTTKNCAHSTVIATKEAISRPTFDPDCKTQIVE